jgi:hypothetical protein
MLTDYIVSVIRTWVPILVGPVVVFLLSLGIEFDSTALELFLASFLSGAYYALVRWAEGRWPWIGGLLGVKSTPTYLKLNRMGRL